jgi:hypothetical protein
MEAIGALAARFKEPSSWAGLAMGATMLGMNVNPGILQGITYIGAGLCSILAIVLPEAAAKPVAPVAPAKK